MQIVLNQKSGYFTLNDGQIEFIGMSKRNQRPRLVVEPNVITNLTDGDIWITFVYSNGPENSMAMIKVDTITTKSFQITNVKLTELIQI